MKILICCKNESIKETLINQCEINGYTALICDTFADSYAMTQENINIFFCEKEEAIDYEHSYLYFKKEREINLPYTIFICEHKLDKVETLSPSKILSIDFNLSKYITYNRLWYLTSEELNTITEIFRYYGFSTFCSGTRYLKEIFKIYYLSSEKHELRFCKIYQYVGEYFGKSLTAVKKACQRSIERAIERKGKGIMEMIEQYNTKKITAKMVIAYMHIDFDKYFDKYRDYHIIFE